MQHKWSKPKQSVFKVYGDVAISMVNNKCGIVIVIQDWDGTFVDVKAQVIEGMLGLKEKLHAARED